MITALAIMIAIAGYLQFAGTGLQDEYLKGENEDTSPVDSNGIINENYTADGLLDLSEDDLLSDLSDIDSLDTDADIIADDYLSTGMQVADVSGCQRMGLCWKIAGIRIARLRSGTIWAQAEPCRPVERLRTATIWQRTEAGIV